MIRHIRWLAAACAAAAVMTMAAPASASSPICEASGGHWCIGTADLNPGTHATERMPGRTMHFNQTGTCIDGTGTNQPCGEMVFDGATNRCLAEISSGLATAVETCGATGTTWLKVPASGGTSNYENRVVTNQFSNGHNFDLTGANSSGSTYAVAQAGCTNSCFQRFSGG